MTIERKGNQIRFTDTDNITYDMWCSFAVNLSYLGYDLDTEQTKQYFDRHEWLGEDQSKAILKILNNEHSLPNNISKEQISHDNDAAIEEFGETNDISITGYILTDGRLLKLSYDDLQRNMDHREIRNIFDEDFETSSDAMTKFMLYGNVRVMSNGIDICQCPNEKQIEKIARHMRYVKKHSSSYFVDISNNEGQTVKSFAYQFPNLRMITDDIQTYFDMIV